MCLVHPAGDDFTGSRLRTTGSRSTAPARACGGLVSMHWSIARLTGRPCPAVTAETEPMRDRSEGCEDIAISLKLLVECGGLFGWVISLGTRALAAEYDRTLQPFGD
jgi:hypothetical protein